MLGSEYNSQKGLLVVAVILFFLQYTLSPIISIFSGHVNFILILIFFLAIFADDKKIVGVVFALGLFQDCTGRGPIGLYALIYVVLMILLTRGDTHCTQAGLREIILPFLVFSASVESLYQVLAQVILNNIHPVSLFFLHIIPSIILDCLFFLLIWWAWQVILTRSQSSTAQFKHSSGYALSSRFKQKR